MDDGRQREAHWDLSNKFFRFGGFDKNLSDAGSYWRVLFALISKAWSVPQSYLFMARDSWSGHFEWRVCMCERRSRTAKWSPAHIFLSTHSCCCSFCLWSIGGIPELGSSADHPVRYLGAGWIFVRFIIVIGRQVELDSEIQFWLTVNRS